MEPSRIQQHAWDKHLLLVLLYVMLGGCGTWCTHMSSSKLVLQDGTIFTMAFELGLKMFSFLLPTFSVWIELRIASSDQYFLDMEASRVVQCVVRTTQA